MKTTLNYRWSDLSEESYLRKLQMLIDSEFTNKGNTLFKVRIEVKRLNRQAFRRKPATGIRKLKKELWEIFSEYVRRRDQYICFTCGNEGNQAGHFIPASLCNPELYTHELNVHCQCYRCNINLQGNTLEYERRLVNKYGIATPDLLRGLQRQDIKWNIEKYERRIADIKKRLEDLKNEQ
ncbi:MAG: recombination protein NinG [bacterium]